MAMFVGRNMDVVPNEPLDFIHYIEARPAKRLVDKQQGTIHEFIDASETIGRGRHGGAKVVVHLIAKSNNSCSFGSMNRTVILLMLLVTGIVACTSRAEKAAGYNDRIIGQQRAIVEALVQMDSTFSDTNASKELVGYQYAHLQAKVKQAILGLDSIGPFQQDPSLQLSARELFRSYEQLIDLDYKKLVEIKLLPAESVNVAIVDTNFAVQERIFMQSKIAQERFYKAQEEFGKKYNLEFE